MKFIVKSVQKKPTGKSLASMSWHDHFNAVQHHETEREKAHQQGDLEGAAYHSKMSEAHHQMRLAKQKVEGVSGPYAGAMSSKHRGSQRKDAAAHKVKAKEILSSLKSPAVKKSFFVKGKIGEDVKTYMQVLMEQEGVSADGKRDKSFKKDVSNGDKTEAKPKTKKNAL